MRIGIDARFLGPVGKGLGRYTQKLVTHLEKIDQNNQYFVFLRRENWSVYQPANRNFKKILADYRWYTWQEQWYLPKILKKYQLDLVHFPYFNVPVFYRGKFIVTIHDLIVDHVETGRASTLPYPLYKIKRLFQKARQQKKPVIFITGGNQGSHIINQTVLEALPALTLKAVIVLQTGDSKFHDFEDAKSKQCEELLTEKWIETQDFGYILKHAHLVVGRSVLIPFLNVQCLVLLLY